jgi:predicted regulator of Ras-like GTPase activity (Roadblock/LC7/MglB family)
VATKFKPILEKLVRNADLEGAVLTTADGLPVEAVLPAGMSEERLAAMSAAILSLGERAAFELEKGNLEQITVKAEKGFVIVTGIGQEAVLTVMAPQDAKLGLLYLEIRKAAEELAKLL